MPTDIPPSEGWKAGLRIGVMISLAGMPISVSFGAFAVSNGWPAAIVILMSTIVFSGSAQFALVTGFASGGMIPAIASATLLNLRFIPLSIATASSLPGSKFRRAIEAQSIVDGAWFAAQRPDGTIDRPMLLTATLFQWPLWIAGTAVGALSKPSTEFVDKIGLDIVFPAFFLVILIDSLRSRRHLIPIALAATAVAAISVHWLSAGVSLIVAAFVALWAIRGTGEPS
ncbi:AzlC family ABC transporter permease [soil metagenome]